MPAGAINNLLDGFSDRQVLRRGVVTSGRGAVGTDGTAPAIISTPMRFSGAQLEVGRSSPLGGRTREIRAELGPAD